MSTTRGTVVCNRPGRWQFRISRILPSSACDLIACCDTEEVAMDTICENFPWITDRDASLAIEEAAVEGTKIIGPLSIVLGKVA